MDLPQTMRAIHISEPGSPDVLQPTDWPTPTPENDQVLIKVFAAGVNRPDVLQRLGKYQVPKDADPLPGLEIAGEIVAIGEDVSHWSLGDRVCALTHGGGYAEYCKVHQSHCLPIPGDFTFVEAAALPETFFTVWTNVFQRAALRPGETLLVHGGSSGIGTTAIQLAGLFDSTVIVTAGSEEKLSYCKNLGAAFAINYKTQDWPQEVMDWTEGRGVDVVLDMVAGPYVQKNIDVMAVDGRYALIAFLKGFKTEINLARFLRDRLTLTGSTLRPQSVQQKAKIASELREYVWPHLGDGRIRPQVFKTFDLEQASASHELMESSQHMGKLILEVTH